MKRDFISVISEVIENKLSVEYFLELTNNFRNLKILLLDENQLEKFNALPYLNLEKQLEEFKQE